MPNQIIHMTLQQVFDTALHGIRSQGYEQSMTRGQMCAYVGHDPGSTPIHCAIGHCFAKAGIDGAVLDRSLALTGVSFWLPKHAAIDFVDSRNTSIPSVAPAAPTREQATAAVNQARQLFAGLDVHVLSELQDVHDSMGQYSCDRSTFEDYMAMFAAKHGLTYAAPEAAAA